MFGELASVFTLGAATCKVIEFATGESKKKQEEMTDRAVERYMDKKNNSDNNEGQ